MGEGDGMPHPAAHWHFGDGGQIVFTSSGPVAEGRSKLRQQEGSSSLSDGKGRLIAYTDGGTVIESGDRALQASQGRSLGGNPSSTQAALLIPKPGKENQVVLLSLDQGGYTGPSSGLVYSEVGKSQEASTSVGREEWSILAQRERLPVSRQLTEKLAAIHHANGRDIWVLTHRTFSDEFAAYLLTDEGLSPEPVVSHSGSVHSGLDDGSIGQMKCSPDGRWVAAAIPNTNQVELHRFDARTGRVFDGIALPQDSAVGRIQLPYGIEFSKDGGHLFVASLLENAVWAYPISEHDKKPSPTKLVGRTRGLTAGSLQLGPDGRIYVALTDGPAGAGSRQVGAVEKTATGSWAYNDSSVVLPAEQRCRLGLPGFVASVFAEPKVDFEASPLCAGDVTRFVNWSTPSDHKPRARWRWHFGDPSSEGDTSSAQEPTYLYQEPGVYSVTLVAELAGRRDSLTRQVRIWSKPTFELGPNQTLPADGSALRIVLPTDPSVVYLWEDGSTSATREFHRPGLVWVQAIRGSCVARDTLRILPRAQGSVVSGSPSQSIQDDQALSERIESTESSLATGESNLASVPGALSLFSSIQVKPVLSLLPTMGVAGVGYAPMSGFTNERSFAHTPLFEMSRLSLQIAPQLGLLFTPVSRKKR